MQWDPNQFNGFVPNGQQPTQGSPVPGNQGVWVPQPGMPTPNQAPMTPEQMRQIEYQSYMQQMPQIPTAQAIPQQPGQQAPQKKPKNNAVIRRVILTVLMLVLAAVLVFGGNLLFRRLRSTQLRTSVIEAAVIGERHVGDALIVRNEVAYDEEGVQNVEYVAQEGSLVKRGDVVCYVYSTGYSNKEMTTLQDDRDQIKSYQQTLLKSETAYDQKMTRLENEVLQRGLEVRSLVQGAQGNLMNEESILDAAITERQNYFRSKYSSDMRLNRLYDDESTQQQRIDSWIKQKVATQESIVSFYTDGFEYALTPSEYAKYSPSQVRSMINGVKPETTTAARGRSDIYRLVKQNNYAVLMLVKEPDWNPTEGSSYTLTLEQFTDTVVDAQVISFTRSGGELLLRLAVIGDVTNVLYIRNCSAMLGESVNCLKVPKSAIYVQNGSQGVVLVQGDRQVFAAVHVLNEENGYVYLEPALPGTVSEGQTVRLF